MPNDQTQEPDSILQNLRLIWSWWNLFVYVVNPALSWAFMMHTCLNLSSEDSYLPRNPRVRMSLAMLYPLIAAILAARESDKIKDRLQAAGYTQRRTRAGEIDILLNFAVCGGCLWWFMHWNTDDGEPAVVWLYVLIVGSGIAMWTMVFLFLLGPVVWFTVKAR